MVRAVYSQASNQKTSMLSLWLKPLEKKIGSGYSPPRQQHLLYKCFPSHVVSTQFSRFLAVKNNSSSPALFFFNVLYVRFPTQHGISHLCSWNPFLFFLSFHSLLLCKLVENQSRGVGAGASEEKLGCVAVEVFSKYSNQKYIWSPAQHHRQRQ